MIFPFVLAIVWFYALFDALQKATLLNARIDKHADDADIDESELDKGILPESIWVGRKGADSPVWFGGVLIAFGILLLLKMIAPDLWNNLRDHQAGSIILAIVLIGFGIWLIRKQTSKKS